MRSPPRWLVGWTSLAVSALAMACETSTPSPANPVADAGGADAGTRPVEDDAAVDHPRPDAAPPPMHDAEVPALRDAGVDAQLDGSTGITDADASTPHDAAVVHFVCNGPGPASCPTPAPRYPEVAAIIKERCASCHSPLWTGPWPLDTYGHVADWQDTIQSNLLDCSMPPPDAGVPITGEERLAILTWIKCGLPQ